MTERVLATKVLVVEDEMMIAWQMRDLLEDMGFQSVRIAGKFAEALAIAEANPPTLLICDVNLGPGPDGIATAAALADQTAIKAVFVTGYAGKDIRTRIDQFDPGAKLLRKPIESGALYRTIFQLLSEPRH